MLPILNPKLTKRVVIEITGVVTKKMLKKDQVLRLVGVDVMPSEVNLCSRQAELYRQEKLKKRIKKLEKFEKIA